MFDEKESFLTEDLKKFNLAKTYLKNGLFQKARSKFEEVQYSENCDRLAKYAIKLCDYEVKNIEVDDTLEFFESVSRIAVAKNDVVLYEETYKLIKEITNEYFVPEDFINVILEDFELHKSLNVEELKEFISKYSESYLFYNLLDNIAEGYLSIRDFDNAWYFVDEARKINPNDSKALLNLLLCKTHCSTTNDLVKLDTPLDQFEEFEELLLTCEDEKQRNVFVNLLKKQELDIAKRKREAEEKIIAAEREKVLQKERKERETKQKVEDALYSIGGFFKMFGPAVASVAACLFSIFFLVGDYGDMSALIVSFVATTIANIIAKKINYNEEHPTFYIISVVISLLSFAASWIIVSVEHMTYDVEVIWGFWNYFEDTELLTFMLAPFAYVLVFSVVNAIDDFASWHDFGDAISSFFGTFLVNVIILALLNLLPLVIVNIEGIDFAYELSWWFRVIPFIVTGLLVTLPEHTNTGDFLLELVG